MSLILYVGLLLLSFGSITILNKWIHTGLALLSKKEITIENNTISLFELMIFAIGLATTTWSFIQ